MATVLIGVLIFGYAAFVIRRKIKDAKNGKFSSCSCEGCSKGCGKAVKK